MGIGQSKNDENNSMEDIKNLRVDEKTRADTLIIVISHDSYHHQGRRVSDRPVVFWLKYLDPARLG